MRLTRGAGDRVEIQAAWLVGDERRRHIRVVMVQTRSVCHEALATPWRRICTRRKPQIPLSDLAILRTSEEKIRRRLRNNALHAIGMTPINPGIGIAIT